MALSFVDPQVFHVVRCLKNERPASSIKSDVLTVEPATSAKLFFFFLESRRQHRNGARNFHRKRGAIAERFLVSDHRIEFENATDVDTDLVPRIRNLSHIVCGGELREEPGPRTCLTFVWFFNCKERFLVIENNRRAVFRWGRDDRMSSNFFLAFLSPRVCTFPSLWSKHAISGLLGRRK